MKKLLLLLVFTFSMTDCAFEWDTYPRFHVTQSRLFCFQTNNRDSHCYTTARVCVDEEARSANVTRFCQAVR